MQNRQMLEGDEKYKEEAVAFNDFIFNI